MEYCLVGNVPFIPANFVLALFHLLFQRLGKLKPQVEGAPFVTHTKAWMNMRELKVIFGSFEYLCF